MIRAGRKHLVRTLDEIATAAGVTARTYRNQRRHKRPGHPAPISSPGARVLLYDAEQIAAYQAGSPIPSLPENDSPDDLLDHQEAADLVDVAPRSWETYKADPFLRENAVPVKGVVHHPRRTITAWMESRPGSGTGGGRPTGTGDLMPREDLLPRTAQLLDAKADITAEQAADDLGVHPDTAQRALTTLRAQRVGELLQAHQELTEEQVIEQLGYPLRAARNALATARAQRRTSDNTPYIQSVWEALRDADVPLTGLPSPLVRPGAISAAIIALGPGAKAPALLWDERYGWRTALDTHAGREAQPPQGPGIRYLGTGIRPPAESVASALSDRRSGTKRPKGNR
ncbi:DUF6292 family protein [Streptomyces sp. NPDC017940]|uniref:DUF6292 family protein n=1 Tax=Streptomyces sp. NPDC017940 TaxID=3365017 RepID=UPI0037BDA1FC